MLISNIRFRCTEIDLKRLEEVIAERGDTISNSDERGQTVLHVAALWCKNAEEVIRMLIKVSKR